jgi:hypothetical protein
MEHGYYLYSRLADIREQFAVKHGDHNEIVFPAFLRVNKGL